jgi:hypothetical protein
MKENLFLIGREARNHHEPRLIEPSYIREGKEAFSRTRPAKVKGSVAATKEADIIGKAPRPRQSWTGTG